MPPEISEIDIEIPEISQVGIVVGDLEDGMDRFGAGLGVGPWAVHRFEPPALTETTYRGQEHNYSMALGLADVGDTMIELIEPLNGESLYTEHLDRHGEGLHHLACFAFDDPEGVVDTFEDADMPVIQSGVYGETPYWYFDTKDALNGIVFETAANVEEMGEPDSTYP